jgi:hypothetical protein
MGYGPGVTIMTIIARANTETIRAKLLEAIDGFDRAKTKKDQERFKALIAHFQKSLGPVYVTVDASGIAV